ncbi:hypothetical protein RDI58_027120 [Solanum bulbocastanum]|uniref:Uncharacterized protein n=1 Tax=Solanum bulbocastanum TaxID=147425 RepID=A0AAN8SY66_SOLBU
MFQQVYKQLLCNPSIALDIDPVWTHNV